MKCLCCYRSDRSREARFTELVKRLEINLTHSYHSSSNSTTIRLCNGQQDVLSIEKIPISSATSLTIISRRSRGNNLIPTSISSLCSRSIRIQITNRPQMWGLSSIRANKFVELSPLQQVISICIRACYNPIERDSAACLLLDCSQDTKIPLWSFIRLNTSNYNIRWITY